MRLGNHLVRTCRVASFQAGNDSGVVRRDDRGAMSSFTMTARGYEYSGK